MLNTFYSNALSYDEKEIREMYDELYSIQDGSGDYAIKSCTSVFLPKMVCPIEGFSEEQKIDIWKVRVSTVAGTYRKVILSIFSTETLAPTLLILIYSGARV